jgi:hypothetical protein
MKYTLAQNAASSLSIAIESFKKFYYLSDKYSQSELDEAFKICIIFLENSIELMLKDILASYNPLFIYDQPNSKVIQNALSKVTVSSKLEDILITEGNFKTIKYIDTVKKYNEKFHNSDKVFRVLNILGERRNAITHFGIDGTNNVDELIISILNAFDIIYNYLYPQLIELDDIGDYFTSDNLAVATIHGTKPLLDDNDIYNNIVDFLDELMETSKEYACSLRASNPKSKICEFTEIMNILIEDYKFNQILKRNNAIINFITCDFENNNFYFEVIKNAKKLDNIDSCYSPYYNVTAFCGESGEIYFLVVHDEHELYIYDHIQNTKWPQHDEAEPDYQWLNDYKNGICKKFNLSKRNLL